MLDGSIIKVHQDAMRSSYDRSAEAIGSSVGGLSTKIHAKVDLLGQLVNILITPGQVHESQVAHEVWAHESCEFFLADKAYDIDGFRKALTDDGIRAVIPSKKNRLNPTTNDRDIYKERNIVERFFQKIKRFRRIATRYDKTARMYLTGMMFVSILLALK
ncbi:IS5 family transposase [Legionella pneumophila serogroup 1]|uniref:IS5 family transposase n=1 Tax=Legionella pneumophila TaxID=446 RepID=UPI0009B40E18|nr:IS5 family transposase [Legionella pneumophila]HCC3237367.1 IS5 family transposase [Legionella pneumophila subsp. pneumophila]HAT8622971.1 IS5 family transposase [Legionella pneumophila]HAU1183521.1 IS5 family transposase [Legionella pneumophila]HAU2265726.1 IS5 family transposase [Legionella pneumophila]HAU3903697.1 IS5 family transposase [Legionella pneumophila]